MALVRDFLKIFKADHRGMNKALFDSHHGPAPVVVTVVDLKCIVDWNVYVCCSNGLNIIHGVSFHWHFSRPRFCIHNFIFSSVSFFYVVTDYTSHKMACRVGN